jgi:hypothetical protein
MAENSFEVDPLPPVIVNPFNSISLEMGASITTPSLLPLIIV